MSSRTKHKDVELTNLSVLSIVHIHYYAYHKDVLVSMIKVHHRLLKNVTMYVTSLYSGELILGISVHTVTCKVQ